MPELYETVKVMSSFAVIIRLSDVSDFCKLKVFLLKLTKAAEAFAKDNKKITEINRLNINDFFILYF